MSPLPPPAVCTFFKSVPFFVQRTSILTIFCLQTFWGAFTGLNNAMVRQNWQIQVWPGALNKLSEFLLLNCFKATSDLIESTYIFLDWCKAGKVRLGQKRNRKSANSGQIATSSQSDTILYSTELWISGKNGGGKICCSRESKLHV